MVSKSPSIIKPTTTEVLEVPLLNTVPYGVKITTILPNPVFPGPSSVTLL